MILKKYCLDLSKLEHTHLLSWGEGPDFGPRLPGFRVQVPALTFSTSGDASKALTLSAAVFTSVPGGSGDKESACNSGDSGDTGLTPGLGRFPWRRKWQPTLIFLPRESYGQKCLVGYSPRGHKESDTTEWLSTQNKVTQYNIICLRGSELIQGSISSTVSGSKYQLLHLQNKRVNMLSTKIKWVTLFPKSNIRLSLPNSANKECLFILNVNKECFKIWLWCHGYFSQLRWDGLFSCFMATSKWLLLWS